MFANDSYICWMPFNVQEFTRYVREKKVRLLPWLSMNYGELYSTPPAIANSALSFNTLSYEYNEGNFVILLRKYTMQDYKCPVLNKP